MFSARSPYSPFFTSGLLSAQLLAVDTPSSSRPPSPDIPLGPRRGSLPTDNLAPRSPTTVHDESAAFYFTMQPKRDQSEFRSFLSLDLAESQSMRSASLKRKASSKRARSGPFIPRIVEESSRLTVPRIPSPGPLRMRYSRDSFRSIPSPKPAPSSNLPDLPRQQAPRLPSIQKHDSLALSFTSPKKSFLPSLRFSRTKAPKSVVQLPGNRASVISQAKTSSSISTRAKRVNRSDALARLEGRVKPAPLKPTFQPQRNFMSMSDDEDDSDSDIDSIGAKSDYSDLGNDFFNAFFEPEDLVLPTAASLPSSPISTSPISTTARRNSLSPPKSSFVRKGKATKDWFPLKSFIDLKNDDESSTWSWRSFIDVASLS